MGSDRDQPGKAEPITRRSFIGSSSALLTGVAVCGALSQQACSASADGQPAAQTTQTNTSPPPPPPPPPPTDDPPATVADVQPHCWLEASDLATGGLADGGAVVKWQDRADSGYDLQFQPTIPDINGVWTHGAPVLNLNAVNGRPAVSFNATKSHTLIWTPGGSLDQQVDGFTAVFVCRPDTTELFDASYLFITHAAHQEARIALILDPNQKGVRAIVRTNSTEFNLPMVTGTSEAIPFGAANAPVWGILVLRVQYVGSSPSATLQVNGTAVSINLPGAVVPTTPSYMNVLCSTSETNHLTCDIAEALFYPGYMSDTQLTGVMAGLQQKYALPA